MFRRNLKWGVIMIAAIFMAAAVYQCSPGRKATDSEEITVISTNAQGTGVNISVSFTRGKEHNHPLMAIWTEDTSGKYIETLYVAESIGKGIFQHGEKSRGKWQAGAIRRPAALPYWSHKRGIQAPDGYYLPTPEEPMPDAVTGPTPQGNFLLESKAGSVYPENFVVLMEINQSWDWNEFWTNNKYPDDEQYKTSSQPSLVYAARIDRLGAEQVTMEPVGHGHYAGRKGDLYPDLSTLTTALDIVKKVTVTVSE